MNTHPRRVSIALGLGLLSCGDPLIEQGFRGEPMLTFTGRIGTATGDAGASGDLRAALFWSPAGTTTLSEVLDELVEQPALSVAVHFPGVFEINIFEPPQAVAWTGPDLGFHVALVLIYEDADGSGDFSPTELRGGARNQAVLWAERPLSGAESPTGNPLASGYHALRLPQPCAVLTPPTGGDACRVPLGAACAADEDCGTGGRCLTQDPQTFWPGGYCVQAAQSGGCTPGNGILRRTSIGGLEASYWHRRCESTAECRVDAGYRCEDDACWPGEPAALVLDRRLETAPLCAPYEVDDDDDGPGHVDDPAGP